MCQLTFINLGSPVFNSNYLIVQSFINTIKDHKDGFGYFSECNGIKKTGVAPSNCTNLGTFIGKLDKEPLMSHVRKATFTNGVKTIDREKSHPFETDKLVLAHNGTLELRTDSKFYKNDYKNLIDSEIFLSVLDSFYTDDISLTDALEKAYAEFTGKFAFLIYSKVTKEFYIARGDTAQLHKKYVSIGGKNIGFIINTNKEDLSDAFLLFRNLMLLKGVNVDWDDKIDELKSNTIFKYNKKTNDIVEMGSLVETKKVIVSAPSRFNNAWETETVARGFNVNNKSKELDKKDQLFQDIYNLCLNWKISVRYLDELLQLTIGKPLLSCEKDDLQLFMEYFVPRIKTWMSGKNVVKEWGKLISNSIYRDLEFHNIHGIQFPYLLENDITKLRDIRRGNDKHFVQ